MGSYRNQFRRTLRGTFGRTLPIAILLLAGTVPAYADVPFAFMIALLPLSVFPLGIIGVLLIESYFVWRFLGLKWWPAVGAVTVANLVSGVIGAVVVFIIGLPIEGHLREVLAGYQPEKLYLVGFAIGQMLLPVIDTVIELPVLRLYGVRLRWRSAITVFAANFASTAFLILLLFAVNTLL